MSRTGKILSCWLTGGFSNSSSSSSSTLSRGRTSMLQKENGHSSSRLDNSVGRWCVLMTVYNHICRMFVTNVRLQHTWNRSQWILLSTQVLSFLLPLDKRGISRSPVWLPLSDGNVLNWCWMHADCSKHALCPPVSHWCHQCFVWRAFFPFTRLLLLQTEDDGKMQRGKKHIGSLWAPDVG